MELIFKSVEDMKEQRKAIGEWVSMTGTRTVDIRLNFNMTNHRSSGWSRVTSTPAKGSLKDLFKISSPYFRLNKSGVGGLRIDSSSKLTLILTLSPSGPSYRSMKAPYTKAEDRIKIDHYTKAGANKFISPGIRRQTSQRH